MNLAIGRVATTQFKSCRGKPTNAKPTLGFVGQLARRNYGKET